VVTVISIVLFLLFWCSLRYDWQRPTFAFEGKGAAGGHTATHHASAAPARPQPVE
ncbi:hypothetical protein ACSLNT_20320, partial [Escherichia coli]|uniref:hypothetical protein n=1 Tax=Escherichia coli TaxID=562 RepID=UPI003EDF53C0